MNNEEAKFHLRACRPGGADADDPALREAIEQANRDPLLREWFRAESELDAAIAGRLRSIRAPREARAAVLAGAHASRRGRTWRWPGWWALAASVILLGVLTVSLLPKPEDPVSVASLNDLIRVSGTGPHVDAMFAETAAIRDWMRDRKAPHDFSLPAGLAQAEAQGCRMLEWQGRKVAMLCFHLDSGEHVDLFVIEGGDLTGTAEGIELAAADRRQTVSWAVNGQTFLLIGEAPIEKLESISRS